MPETPTAAEIDTVLSFPGGEKLHLPDEEDGILCSCGDDQWREKPLASFPEGHRNWCKICLELFQARKATGFYSC